MNVPPAPSSIKLPLLGSDESGAAVPAGNLDTPHSVSIRVRDASPRDLRPSAVSTATDIDAAAAELEEFIWPFLRVCSVLGLHHSLSGQSPSLWKSAHTALITSTFVLHAFLSAFVSNQDENGALRVQAAFGLPALFVYASACALLRNRGQMVDAFAPLFDGRRAILYQSARREFFHAQKSYVRYSGALVFFMVLVCVVGRLVVAKIFDTWYSSMMLTLHCVWLSAFSCAFACLIVVWNAALLAAERSHEMIVSRSACETLRESVSGNDMYRYALDTVLHNRRRLLESARAVGWLSISTFVVCGAMTFVFGLTAVSTAGATDSAALTSTYYSSLSWFTVLLVFFLVALFQAARVSTAFADNVIALSDESNEVLAADQLVGRHAWLMQSILASRESDWFTVARVPVTISLAVQLASLLFSSFAFILSKSDALRSALGIN